MRSRIRISRRWLSAYLVIVVVTTLGWFTVLSPQAVTLAQTAVPAAKKPATLEAAEQAYSDASILTADLLWMKVENYYHKGDFDKIIELCYHIVDLDPKFVEAYNTGAWLLWSKLTPEGDKAAVELYERGMKANPEDFENAFECGNFFYLIHKRDAKSAIPYLRHAVRVAERYSRDERKIIILRTLGHALRRDGQTEEALKVFRRVLEINPTDAIALKEVRRLEEGQSAP